MGTLKWTQCMWACGSLGKSPCVCVCACVCVCLAFILQLAKIDRYANRLALMAFISDFDHLYGTVFPVSAAFYVAVCEQVSTLNKLLTSSSPPLLPLLLYSISSLPPSPPFPPPPPRLPVANRGCVRCLTPAIQKHSTEEGVRDHLSFWQLHEQWP